MTALATLTAVELLRFPGESYRTGQMILSLTKAAGQLGMDLCETSTYAGDRPWLCLWGPGAPERRDLMRAHVAAGGHAIALDLAYWKRDIKIRVSIDHAHPQAWVMTRDWPRSRFAADRVMVGNTWQPTGSIVVAGIGRKARVQYGHDEVEAWEIAMMAACRERWPTRRIIYRPKQADAPIPKGPYTVVSGGGPIDAVLRGASLVVTWHSNVAVDAIRLGIPVVCRDGAAAAVCPATLPENPTPLSVETRDRFLGNLAWFQWAPAIEASSMWTWLQELLS